MKLLMLCREPRLYSCERLKTAAEQLGHTIDILDPNRCFLKIFSENTPRLCLFYANGEQSYKLEGYHAILPRFGTASTQMGCTVLRYFEGKNIPCLNSSVGFQLARDKWASLQTLTQQGLPVPSSIFAGGEVSAQESNAQMSEPCILKTLSGSQGVGVMLAESKASAVSILETLRQANLPVLQQQFISEAKNADIRCFVIGDKVVAAMQRTSQEGEFRANFHRGGNAKSIILSEAEQQLAIRATKAIGLEVAGVDLIRSAQGTLILEVNASPGLELIERTSNIDIAQLMIRYIANKAQTSTFSSR